MDILLIAIVILMLPLIAWRPYVGAVLYTILAYLRPQNLTGGLAAEWRLSLLVLIAMGVGVGIGMLRNTERPAIRLPFFGLLAALLATMWVSTKTAIFPSIATDAWLKYLQMLSGVAFTVMLCNTPARLKGILVTATVSLGIMAIVGVLDPTWDSGRLMGFGGQFKDSNDFALALTMALPLFLYFRRSETNPWKKALLTIPIPFVLAAIVLTYSRGGFLACAAVLTGWMLLSRGRMVRLALAPIAVLLFAGLAPAKYWDRVGSIQGYQHDSSARDRLSSWNVATRIAEERPLTGVGPGNFLVVYDRYKNDFRMPHVAHNTVLQVAADSGLPAAALFVALLLTSIAAAWRLGRRASAFRSRLLRGEGEGDRARAKRIAWMEDYAYGLMLSLAGFAVGSQFLSRDGFDLLYLLMGSAGALAVVARRELAAEGYRRPMPRPIPSIAVPSHPAGVALQADGGAPRDVTPALLQLPPARP